MSFLSHGQIEHLLQGYGYGFVGLVVGIESMGVPLPGEAVLLAASFYAAATHHLAIEWVVAAAAGGAILGDNLGFLIGHEVGARVLRRFGHYIRLTPARLRLGQYLFLRHGGKVVFFGRFISVLRTFAALLAGANRMPWPHFLVWNAAGGIVWASLYGFGAYALGKSIKRLEGPVGITVGVVAAICVLAGLWQLRRHEAQLQAEADRVIPERGARPLRNR